MAALSGVRHVDGEAVVMSEVEQAIERHGFHEQFLAAIDGLDGDREALAFMFFAGLSAYAKVIGAQISEWQRKLPAHIQIRGGQ